MTENPDLYGADALRWTMQRHPEWFAPEGKASSPVTPAATSPAPPPVMPPINYALVREIAQLVRKYVDDRLAAHHPQLDVDQQEQLARDLGAPLSEYVEGQVSPLRRTLDELCNRAVTRQCWNQDLEIRSIDSARREIAGVCSSSSIDRVNDSISPRGGKWKIPGTQLLWMHQHGSPIGQITEIAPTDTAVLFRAKVAKFDDPDSEMGRLTNKAWDCLTSGLCRGVSIGFLPITSEPLPGGNGVKYLTWHGLEISLTTVPCNPDCAVTVVRTLEDDMQAEIAALRDRVTELETRRYGGTANER